MLTLTGEWSGSSGDLPCSITVEDAIICVIEDLPDKIKSILSCAYDMLILKTTSASCNNDQKCHVSTCTSIATVAYKICGLYFNNTLLCNECKDLVTGAVYHKRAIAIGNYLCDHGKCNFYTKQKITHLNEEIPKCYQESARSAFVIWHVPRYLLLSQLGIPRELSNYIYYLCLLLHLYT